MRRVTDWLLREKVSDVLWAALSLLVFLVVVSFFYLGISLPIIDFRFDQYTCEVNYVSERWSGIPEHPQIGDTLLQIGDVTSEEFLSSRNIDIYRGYASEKTMPVVVERGGERLELDVHLSEQRFWRAAVVLRWYLPLIFWLLGTFAVLFLRPREERWLVLVANYYVTAIWVAAGFLSSLRIAYAAVVFHTLIWFFLPLVVHLHLVLPNSLMTKAKNKVLGVAYLGAVVFAVLDFLKIIGGNSYFWAVLLGSIFTIGILVKRLIDRSSLEVQRANRLILFGTIIGLGPLILLALITLFLPGSVVLADEIVAIMVLLVFPLWPFSYVYALYRPGARAGIAEYRANRFLGAYTFFAVFLLTFAMSFGAIAVTVGVDADTLAVSLLLSIIFVGLAPILRIPCQRLIDRVIFGIKYEANEVVGIFARRVPAANSRAALRNLILEEILPTLMIRQSALYIVVKAEEGSDDWTDIQTIYTQKIDNGIQLEELRALLERSGRYLPPTALIATDDDWIRLVIPLAVHDEIIGVWLLGRRDPDDYYPREDIKLLSSLAGQIAPVIENFRLVEMARQEVEENKKLQKQLLHSQKMEAIGSLSAGVAHDFNNLLSIILGNSYLLIEDYEDNKELVGFLGEIRDAGEKASSLTRQLLTFSRQGTMEVMVVDLNDVVDSIEQMLAVMAGKTVELDINLANDLPAVHVDPDQMSQVIINLTVNARDAMSEGGRVRIETKPFELSEVTPVAEEIGMPLGSYVLLRVADNGTGISPEVRSRIFEPFFTTKEPGKGTGLGLSMVYGIINQSKGYLHLETELGVGTTFNIFLPVAEEDVAPVIEEDLTEEALLGSETVLLVEDEESVREVARMILMGQGYEVLSAGSGGDALKVARNSNGAVSLLLTDVIMPEMRGPELARQLAARLPTLKVLYMSGYHDESVFDDYVEGFRPAMIQKPFSPLDLSRKVREVLDSHEPIAANLRDVSRPLAP